MADYLPPRLLLLQPHATPNSPSLLGRETIQKAFYMLKSGQTLCGEMMTALQLALEKMKTICSTR